MTSAKGSSSSLEANLSTSGNDRSAVQQGRIYALMADIAIMQRGVTLGELREFVDALGMFPDSTFVRTEKTWTGGVLEVVQEVPRG